MIAHDHQRKRKYSRLSLVRDRDVIYGTAAFWQEPILCNCGSDGRRRADRTKRHTSSLGASVIEDCVPCAA